MSPNHFQSSRNCILAHTWWVQEAINCIGRLVSEDADSRNRGTEEPHIKKRSSLDVFALIGEAEACTAQHWHEWVDGPATYQWVNSQVSTPEGRTWVDSQDPLSWTVRFYILCLWLVWTYCHREAFNKTDAPGLAKMKNYQLSCSHHHFSFLLQKESELKIRLDPNVVVRSRRWCCQWWSISKLFLVSTPISHSNSIGLGLEAKR